MGDVHMVQTTAVQSRSVPERSLYHWICTATLTRVSTEKKLEKIVTGEFNKVYLIKSVVGVKPRAFLDFSLLSL